MKKNFTLLWQRIADRLAAQVSADTFQRWFASVELVHADEERLELQVPNNIFQVWIETNYMPLLQGAVLDVLGSARKIDFRVSNGSSSHAPGRPSDHKTAVDLRSVEAATHPQPRARPFAGGCMEGAPAHGLNPRNTFENFVVGSNSQFAHAAALAVAQAPARTYNPLFVFGGSGLGKTHLMHAIGQSVVSKGKGVKIIYVTSERFTNEFIDAIQNSTLVKFRKRYRQADVLLIDDIHFFGGRERSQEEFFHTFNTLMDSHKQIVLSSDRPPVEIANLEKRLVSRFEWGLTAEIQPPDVETRMAILRKKAESLNIKLPQEILEFLAQRIRTNVRRLEGALMRVAAYSSLHGTHLLAEDIERLLKDILQEEAKRSISIEQIQRCVAEHYDIRNVDMTSKRRPKNIAFPRQIAMYLARELTSASFSEIGEAFGGRDHGTVLHACRLVKEKIAKEEKTRQTISFLDSKLQR